MLKKSIIFFMVFIFLNPFSFIHAMENKSNPIQEGLFRVCKGLYRTQLLQMGSSETNAAKVFINQGASASARDEGYETPLHLAAKIDAYGVARVLLEHGANPRATDLSDETPLHTAIPYRSWNFIDVLLAHDKSIINVPDSKGDAALHIAARKWSEESIEYLIKNGADSSQRNNKNQTPEDVARENYRNTIANFIVECVEKYK